MKDSQDKGESTLVSDWSQRRSLPLAPEVPPHNQYDALGLEGGYYVSNGKDLRKGNHKKLAHLLPASEPVPQKKAERVLIIGDLSLRGTEAPICHLKIISPERFASCLVSAFAILQKGCQAWGILKTTIPSYFFT